MFWCVFVVRFQQLFPLPNDEFQWWVSWYFIRQVVSIVVNPSNVKGQTLLGRYVYFASLFRFLCSCISCPRSTLQIVLFSGINRFLFIWEQICSQDISGFSSGVHICPLLRSKSISIPTQSSEGIKLVREGIRWCIESIYKTSTLQPKVEVEPAVQGNLVRNIWCRFLCGSFKQTHLTCKSK